MDSVEDGEYVGKVDDAVRGAGVGLAGDVNVRHFAVGGDAAGHSPLRSCPIANRPNPPESSSSAPSIR